MILTLNLLVSCAKFLVKTWGIVEGFVSVPRNILDFVINTSIGDE